MSMLTEIRIMVKIFVTKTTTTTTLTTTGSWLNDKKNGKGIFKSEFEEYDGEWKGQ